MKMLRLWLTPVDQDEAQLFEGIEEELSKSSEAELEALHSLTGPIRDVW